MLFEHIEAALAFCASQSVLWGLGGFQTYLGRFGFNFRLNEVL